MDPADPVLNICGERMRPGLSTSHAAGASPYLAGRTILQIIPELNAGGAERTAIDVAAALVEAGARALVACEGGRLVSELQARGGLWIPFPAKTKNPLRMAANVLRLQKLIAREAVDLVHARSRAPAWVALGAARRANVPFVTTYHGAYAGRSSLKILYNSVMARGDAVIANSAFTRDLILAAHPFAAERVVVIHRGADLRALSPEAVEPARVQRLRRAWGVEPDDRIVLLAARLTPWKGQRVLIEAARLLAQRGFADVRYVLAGDPQGRQDYVRDLETRIKDAGLEGIVRLVGHCEDMPAAFLAAAAVAVPSTEPEAFGRSAVEAQAMGAPVVVTDIGATPETVLAPPEAAEDERTGWRVPPDDPPALADALAGALSLGASQRDALASRARRHVERHFSLERMCEGTLEVYSSLLEARMTAAFATRR
jgi:glycosyltransferase involved in cell wall biosynthesis